MTDPTNIVLWKVATIHPEPPPLSRQNLLFHVSENPGLYRQFGIASQHRYLPYLLTPTVTYHQTIRNLLTKKLQIHTKEPRQPLKLYIPSIAVEGIFQIAQIRLFQPNILSLTARLSGLPLYLAPDALIQIQRLNEIKPISEIMRWTIGMAQTLDHRRMEVPSSFRPKPAISLQVQCDSTTSLIT